MATEDDKVNTGALGTLVAVGASAMIGISLAVNALVRHEVGNLSAVRDEAGEDAYRSLRKAQLEKLEAPAAWAEKGKGQISIPVERAMKLVLTDLKRSPWNATPAPPLDAGTDAAAEAPDAGALPEPQSPAPLSPVAPTPSAGPLGAPKPSAPRTPPPPTVPAAPAPPATPPAPPAPPTPPATP